MPRDMTAYQGHGSVATPHGILITWALMMEGGYPGQRARPSASRTSTTATPSSAEQVLAQPGGIAWNVYDERAAPIRLDVPDYREAERPARSGAPTSRRSRR